MTLSISVAQPSDAANRAITIRNQALCDVVNWTNDNWATIISGSRASLQHPLAGCTTMWEMKG